jgi:hypothetical protein
MSGKVHGYRISVRSNGLAAIRGIVVIHLVLCASQLAGHYKEAPYDEHEFKPSPPLCIACLVEGRLALLRRVGSCPTSATIPTLTTTSIALMSPAARSCASHSLTAEPKQQINRVLECLCLSSAGGSHTALCSPQIIHGAGRMVVKLRRAVEVDIVRPSVDPI